MDLTEAANRILRHWRLICVLTSLITLVPIAMHFNHDSVYKASARISIGSDTASSQQAEALADTALGVVSSPSRVALALEGLSVDRDPTAIANNRVEVDNIGISGVLVVSVSDANPQVARDLANLLSEQFLASRTGQAVAPLEQRLAEVGRELEVVASEILEIERVSNGLSVSSTTIQVRLDEVLQRRRDLRLQEQELSSALVAAPKPIVIDPATTPSSPESERLAANLVVAALLGLVAAVSIAATLETLRPTIVGAEALARFLGAPVIGQLSNAAIVDAPLNDASLPFHLGLAATRSQVESVTITSVDGVSMNAEHVVAELSVASPDLVIEPLWSDDEDAHLGDVRSAKTRGVSDGFAPIGARNQPRTGLVVIAPTILRRGDLQDLEHLLAITGWPLLGIVITSRRGWWDRMNRATTVDIAPVFSSESGMAESEAQEKSTAQS